MALTQHIDPLTDTRWLSLVSRHPGSTVFHSPEWLAALHRTYGYEPVALASAAADGGLHSAVVFCRVSTWLTARRLVSLPFTDHCEPLITGPEDISCLLSALEHDADSNGCKHIELRPLGVALPGGCGLEPSQTFCHHVLDLRPTPADLFRAFHKDCVQRKIHRAERESLECHQGRSPELLRKFYRLQIVTRRRLGLPPQPFAWFQNLAACMGEKLKIRVAFKDGRPVAGILTLQHRRTLVYKYGCSDKAFSSLGGMQLLFWRAIQDAKSEGLSEFDLGRSDQESDGLIRFKDRLGAARSTLTYWRYPASAVVHAKPAWQIKVAKRVTSCLPEVCLSAAGNLLYRHVG